MVRYLFIFLRVLYQSTRRQFQDVLLDSGRWYWCPGICVFWPTPSFGTVVSNTDLAIPFMGRRCLDRLGPHTPSEIHRGTPDSTVAVPSKTSRCLQLQRCSERWGPIGRTRVSIRSFGHCGGLLDGRFSACVAFLQTDHGMCWYRCHRDHDVVPYAKALSYRSPNSRRCPSRHRCCVCVSLDALSCSLDPTAATASPPPPRRNRALV